MYGFSTTLDTTFEDADARTRAALAKEGFGIITEINIQAVMKAKLDVDRAPYTILGACNPNIANRALDQEPDIGLLLPCNVVVRSEPDGKQTVSFMDPQTILGLVDNPDITVLGKEVRDALMRVRDDLAGA